MRLQTLLVACLTLCHSLVCFGGTIRDDRDDSLYTGLAAQPQFRASGYLRIGTAVFGSGTLIDPQWVLTAAHCVIDENGPTATTWRFEIGGEVVDIPIENVYFPSAWITSGFDAGYDVALLRLPRPFRGVRPAALYTDRDEVGKVITTLGYGTTGNGQTGNLLPSGAPGDSGGGAFVMAGSGSRILGVVSRGYSPNGRAQSVYGTTAVYTRVSSNLDWIRSVTAGQQMPMPTLLAQVQQGTLMRAAAVSKQRAEMAAAKGYRVVRFVGEGAPEPSAKKPR